MTLHHSHAILDRRLAPPDLLASAMLSSAHRRSLLDSVQRDDPLCYRWDCVLPGVGDSTQRCVGMN